jgi:hypothetical protein
MSLVRSFQAQRRFGWSNYPHVAFDSEAGGAPIVIQPRGILRSQQNALDADWVGFHSWDAVIGAQAFEIVAARSSRVDVRVAADLPLHQAVFVAFAYLVMQG